tara:strand:+ start:4651 stop:7143 length:2493 start_codon:yes stop_codon:yes gene_type:complete
MAENKSFYRRAVDYLQKPPERVNLKRGPLDKYDTPQGSTWGYNTQSGYFPQKLIEDLGDGLGNSAVVACINVLATSFAEPQLKVYKRSEQGKLEQKSHPLEQLLNRPNEFISGSILSHYIVTSLAAHGDAFLMKVYDGQNNVVQLIPLMPNYVKVRGNTRELITHYEYHAVQKSNLQEDYIEIPRENIVHVRQGMDPDDHRRGFSPLRSVMRELAGDEAAGQFAVALLHNMAVPGVILSPKDDSMGGPTREEAEGIAQSFKSKFAGANRGAPMIMTGAMDVDVVSFTPEQLNLTALRRLPEERVSSVLGVPAILAGLGAGLDAATYNNTRELREFFTEQKMIPMWSSVADELTHQLLHKDFENNNYDFFCAYDLDQVRALSEDKKEQVLTMNSGVQGGFVTISEARQALGLEVDNSHDVYLRPLNMVAVPEGETGVMTLDEGEPSPSAQKPSDDEDEKATLNTTRFKPEVRRSKRRIGKRKAVIIDTTMEFKASEKDNIKLSAEEEKAAISAKVKKVLQKKVKDHNAGSSKYKVTYGKLAAVFRRGVGAYRTNPASVRGNVASATQWGIARVNAWLKGLKGSFPRKPFDLDLLPAGHPQKKKPKKSKAASVKVGDTVSWSINKDPDPPSTVHGVVTSVNNEKKEATMTVYAIMDDGSHKKTDRSVTMPFGKLSKIKDFRKEIKAEKLTNFPSSGDNQKLSLSNSKFKQFPDKKYVDNLKENYPSIWRRAGTGGNPPTSFTGNDAYRNWTKYKAGDRSASVLSWVKRRESFMARHEGNTRLNGIIAVMKWGGVTKSGVSTMKKIVNEQKKKEDARKKKADEILSHADDLTS